MIKTTQGISYAELTFLPVRLVADSNGIGRSILVMTPHKGQVIIDEQRVSTAMFGANRNIQRDMTTIISELRTLERESQDFLVEEWKSKLKP